MAIYGANLGPPSLAGLVLNATGLVDTQLAGTRVTFDGIAAPMIYTSAGQIAAVVPYSISSTSPQVVVTYNDQASAPFPLTLATTAPAIFTADSSGTGPVAGLNQDGNLH